ncbi:MAG: histone H1 [Chloroflexi bacterium]|nr:histone H1 [Chloroflexota bacterium]
MEKKQRKPRREHDFSLTALQVVQEATGQVEPEPEKPKKAFDAKALGHKGGLKGGKARAEKLTPEQRKEIATKAAQARWEK